MSERDNEQTERTEQPKSPAEGARDGPDSSVRQDRPDLGTPRDAGTHGTPRDAGTHGTAPGGSRETDANRPRLPEASPSYRTMEYRNEDRLAEKPPHTLELRKEDMTPDAVSYVKYTGTTENTASGGMSGPNATSSPGRTEAAPVQTEDPRVAKPGEPAAQKQAEKPEKPEKKGADGRTDTDVRKELEKKTGKSYNELVVGLGRGPIDPAKISPRDLERELVNNGTLRPILMDTKEPVVIDNVLTPDSYREQWFYNDGRVGPESKIDAAKAAGQQAVRDAVVQGIASGIAGMRPGSASDGIVKPAPEQRRYEPRPPTTYEPRQGAYHPEPPKWGGKGPQGPENNSQLTVPRVVTGEVKTANSIEEGRNKTLTEWAAQHPEKSCVAVVTYDAHGNLGMEVYLAGGNQDLVWRNDNIGHIDPSKLPKEAYQSSAFGTKIEPAVTQYVGEYLGQHFQTKSGSATGPDLVPGQSKMKFNLMTK
ncbi:hypothetical protein [Streptomyces alboniger]|uniref:Uncharacterized protein n=1 Tax=Streptomyces alboniger TaxID=132473 RepID=A0A5J6HNN8_STRAD|nr:hypothetical protein [Streptomyces alboniger]QEV21088.1 hypothetical protein CP975_29205 [Streptomyces alboniger]